jgi:hypothetical protein
MVAAPLMNEADRLARQLRRTGGAANHHDLTRSAYRGSGLVHRPSADGEDWQLAMLLFGMFDWMLTSSRSDGRLIHESIAPVVIDLFMGGLETISLPAR